MVLMSEVTRIRCCSVARANTSGSGTPCRLAAQTTANDGMVEAGIRQEADHASASSRLQLLPHAFELLFEIGRSRMRRAVCILLALALRYVAFHFALVAQVESNCAINLLQA